MASVGDYTIGCICALSIEAVALRLFLDEEHKCPEIESSHASTQDHNVYTTGAIGGHKIVIATLPLGKYGVSQATGVIGDMIRSFPNLRCCLMVGIGGGAPSSQHDIRLGDIVVSAPVGGSGGILQYDHGKAVQGQPFRVTQHLNEPPSILLSAIGKLVQDYELDEHPLQNMVDGVFATRPRLKATYQRPDDSSDRLYKSNFIHPQDTRGNCEQLCGTRDSEMADRHPRASGINVAEIHYGIIASGSSLMKDATVRDRLSEDEQVLCFEMEAAGLMNQFPCLVIRGICDYSDSHKNDDWQKYAAMMAAAYAKEVLRVLMPRKVKQAVDRLSGKLNDIGECIQDIATRQQGTQDSERRKRLLNWIPSNDYSARQNALQQEIQDGTGQWFLNNPVFRVWLRQRGAILFCPGMPGAGKTHIAALAIHHLQHLHPFDPTPGLAYIYCEYTQQLTRETVLGSLLEQLARLLHPLPTHLYTLYQKHKEKKTQPSIDELRAVLRDIAAAFERSFIVVDGLDECTDDEGIRTFLLEVLIDLQQSAGVNILAMSRYIQHIQDMFNTRECLEIHIRASDHDIGMYLDQRIPLVLQLLADSPGLCRRIKDVIMAVADGMFLLAILHVNSLKGTVNVKDVEDALVGIQSGGSSLEKAYDKTMKMIESQDRGFRKLAMHTFAWVAFSSAPLKGEELQHALAIELGKDSLDFNNITKLDIIISTCAGLIRLQNQWFGTTVHLVHETTQDYFDKTFVNVRPRLARLSLTYLTFQTFGSGPCESDEEQALKQQQYPLYYYLGLYLLGYIHDNAEDSKVKTMLKKFLLEDANVAAHMQTIPKSYVSSFGSPALNLAIFYRCGSLIPLLVHLRRKEHIHWGHTARFASQTKYFEGIKYLLSASEIDCNATSILKRTNLSEACRMGDENFVRLLLACDGIDCNLVDTYGRSPLTYALAGGHEAIVQLLLERVDVDYTSPSGFDIDPLSYAFHGESEGCVKELLKKPDVDANRILYWALWRWGGRISTFKELLRRPDFNVNWVDSQGWTLLILCIECRSLQPALLLLSHEDVNLNRPEETEPGPLIRAAKWGQPVLMEALLAKMGPYIFAKDSSRRTALDHAAESRNWQTVIRLLEEYETKISIECCFEHSALFHALKRAPPEVVEILFGQMNLNDSWWFVPALAISMESNTLECFLILEIKLQSWMQCHPEWMNVCLLRAAGKGTDGTLASILRCLRYYADGIDVEKVQFPHRVYWDNISMLEIVFDIPSAQLNIRDGQGQTALHAMARRQDFPATRILLVLGADTDARDDEGRTAFECASHWPDDLGWLKRNMLPSWHVALPRDWSWHISP